MFPKELLEETFQHSVQCPGSGRSIQTYYAVGERWLKEGKREERLSYAKRDRKWSENQRQQIWWNDESKFEVSVQIFINIRRKVQQWVSAAVQPCRVSGCISTNGSGDLTIKHWWNYDHKKKVIFWCLFWMFKSITLPISHLPANQLYLPWVIKLKHQSLLDWHLFASNIYISLLNALM